MLYRGESVELFMWAEELSGIKSPPPPPSCPGRGRVNTTQVFSAGAVFINLHFTHRRKMCTEKKAKVVAAVLGTEFINFLATLAILHQDDLKNGIT